MFERLCGANGIVWFTGLRSYQQRDLMEEYIVMVTYEWNRYIMRYDEADLKILTAVFTFKILI
jgi:hypothetical protein